MSALHLSTEDGEGDRPGDSARVVEGATLASAHVQRSPAQNRWIRAHASSSTLSLVA